MKKFTSMLAVLFVLQIICPVEIDIKAASNLSQDITTSYIQKTGALSQESVMIAPRGDKIVWKYKKENGSYYRRQYNETKKKWIGKWELC